MNLRNVKLVFSREMRDQLRDRRTLFLIAVLPLLLYPLLGMSFFQLSQFLRNNASQILVLGEGELADLDWLPPLVEQGRFDLAWFGNPNEQDSLELTTPAQLWPERVFQSPEELEEAARLAVELGDVQLVLRFPPGLREQLVATRAKLMERVLTTEPAHGVTLPEPELYFNSAEEKSRIAQLRVDAVLRQWRSAVTQINLRDSQVPLEATSPFSLKQRDVAREQQRQAAVWSKILPFVLFIWALTGAFYPAIDLCAGEKERGTLETLLVSPAERKEIVWGKLLTIMTFSVLTALLNLASMGITAKFILSQFQQIGTLPEISSLSLPPLVSIGWLVLGLLPIAAFFSAMCLACAALARSTKEGQYYLMPLLLVIMPLMMLPLSPGVELNLGNSLIPVTGLVLLLRAAIEGQYWQTLPYLVPVVGVTLCCCLLAIRWAEDQFNRESVLFRESERLDLVRWFVHMLRDRSDTPTLAQAVICIALIALVQFFVNLSLSAQHGAGVGDFATLAQIIFISQVVCIGMPVALLTLFFVRRPAQTFLLDRLPRVSHVAGAAILACLMFPLGQQFARWVQQLYPYSSEVEAEVNALGQTLSMSANWWLPVLLIGVLPAICEEFAFRGFILSGLRHLGHKWWAIGISAAAFGMAHFILQQKISAAAVGLVIGMLAVQTKSLVPCMVFHAIYNSLILLVGHLAEGVTKGTINLPFADFVFRDIKSGSFGDSFMALCLLGSGLLLWWFHRLPYQRTNEEQLQESLDKQYAGV